jgi:hypothetical protein
MRDEVSHPYKTVGEIIVLYMFVFAVSRCPSRCSLSEKTYGFIHVCLCVCRVFRPRNYATSYGAKHTQGIALRGFYQSPPPPDASVPDFAPAELLPPQAFAPFGLSHFGAQSTRPAPSTSCLPWLVWKALVFFHHRLDPVNTETTLEGLGHTRGLVISRDYAPWGHTQVIPPTAVPK